MRLSSILGYSVASLALPVAVVAGSVHSQHLAKRHHDLVHRSNNFTIDLEKRQGSNARFTFYDAGLYVFSLSACGHPVNASFLFFFLRSVALVDRSTATTISYVFVNFPCLLRRSLIAPSDRRVERCCMST